MLTRVKTTSATTVIILNTCQNTNIYNHNNNNINNCDYVSLLASFLYTCNSALFIAHPVLGN